MTYLYDPQLDAFEQWHKAQQEDIKLSILGGPALPALGHAISGSLGSAISNVMTYPLSLVITRLQVQKQFKNERASDEDIDYKSIADAIQKIYAQEGGITAFYSGCLQDTAKSMADSFLFFLAYNFIRRGRLNSQASGSKRLPVQEEIAVGMAAGAFAKLFTTPIQNIVTRKQTAAMVAARSSNSTASPRLSARDIALQIRHEKGIQGFWSGYSASLVLTLNPALTFLFHETLLRMLVRREKRSDPGARLTFLVAAASKAMASTITYPFSLAKSRAQVSSESPIERTVEPISEKDSLGAASSKSAANFRRNTIFDSILQIARTEGLTGLYQGVSGEVLKGFFSHGTTMLLKERIHKMVIQLYYLVLRAMQTYPSPEELKKLVGDQASEFKDAVGDKMTAAGERASELKDAVGEKVTAAGTSASGMAQKTMNAAKDAINSGEKKLSNGIGGAQDVVDKGIDTMSHLYRKGKEDATDLVDEYINTGDDDD